ncbi:MAG: DUF3299 domain-containing protein [Phycisphaerales bacterium]
MKNGKNVLIASMSIVCGMAMTSLAGDTPITSPAAAPAGTPASKTESQPATAPKSEVKDATNADKAKDAKAKAEPAAPSLAPGAVGSLASLQEHFPSLKSASKADGTLIIEERFPVTGKGTLEDPFVVTWDQLTSASEVYDPRKGQKKIPDRVQMLDGQFVTVTGYVAFPIYVKEPKEMLSMLNQWDGCCIGTPPTPYDAIEVHLKDPATKEQRMATYGTISGRLSVKPYLVGDWLVGLYVMDEAAVSKPKQGGTGS